jgi:HTH-type transcriptional regulator/antitoxin HigA
MDFIPRWASPPGDTIRDALDEQRLDPATLAARLELSHEKFESFLAGKVPLTIRLAERLSATIGGSVEFWMTRDSQYRADQSRVAADKWAQRMPLRDMKAFGWITSDATDWVEQIDACLAFFDVPTPEVWKDEHAALTARVRFRTSPTIQRDEYAVAAWLRQCEVELSQIPCRDWDATAFAALLPELLSLTRERDPRVFLKELQTRCADAGVAVGVVRAPRGCPVSGAARTLANGQPSIALSGRYLVDDHLWFTFFHEAAHLLLHGPDWFYLDEIEPNSGAPQSEEEAEADNYAGELLVPRAYDGRLAQASGQPFELKAIANEIGVSLGVVVGQLQHRGILGYNTRFNKLKRRYKWDGPSLEKA